MEYIYITDFLPETKKTTGENKVQDETHRQGLQERQGPKQNMEILSCLVLSCLGCLVGLDSTGKAGGLTLFADCEVDKILEYAAPILPLVCFGLAIHYET